MANMMDYLDWRGDLTFAQSAFNKVDNLILSLLVYVDLEGTVGGFDTEDRIRVEDASRIFFETHDEEEILKRVSLTKTSMYILRKMAQTKRFKDVELFHYVNEISEEEQSQFSAVCAALGDGSLFLSFSGTDDTIVGWREDFNMGFLSETPGQLKAADYLNAAAKYGTEKIRIGGHSKGGNLAVYAAVKCSPAVKERIVEIYSNDGPGFSRGLVESEEYRQILPKIKAIVPEASIIGMLFEHGETPEIVKSTNNGILQHDALSWEVLGTGFVRTKEFTPQSVLLNDAIKGWLYELNAVQRKEIINTVFHMLKEAEIKTVDDFYHSKWRAVSEMIKARSELPEETQKLLSKAVKLLWKTGNATVKKSVRHAVKERRELSGEMLRLPAEGQAPAN